MNITYIKLIDGLINSLKNIKFNDIYSIRKCVHFTKILQLHRKNNTIPSDMIVRQINTFIKNHNKGTKK